MSKQKSLPELKRHIRLGTLDSYGFSLGGAASFLPRRRRGPGLGSGRAPCAQARPHWAWRTFRYYYLYFPFPSSDLGFIFYRSYVFLFSKALFLVFWMKMFSCVGHTQLPDDPVLHVGGALWGSRGPHPRLLQAASRGAEGLGAHLALA